jgi:putative DeoR family transcriptional regulator (stage III sporulation protein D)
MRKEKRTPAGRETIPPDLAQRCLRIATYMLEHHATVRQAAKAFGLSKSSVHKDMHQRLPQLSESLGRQVELLLQYNKAVRHLRGGAATRKKFLEARAAEDSPAVMRQ